MTQTATLHLARLRDRSGVRARVIAYRTACTAIPLAVWFWPSGATAGAQHAVAIASFMVLGWITEVIDHALVGLIGCYLFWALGVTSFGIAFGGFAADTTWFSVGAMLIGATVTKSGLGRRLAFFMMNALGRTYSRIVLSLIVTDVLLTVIVPSGVARVVILSTITLGVAQALGATPRSNIGRGLFVTIAYASPLFDKMIVAGTTSITARGLIQQFGHVDLLWSRWLLAFLPCTLLTIVIMWRLALHLYPDDRPVGAGDAGWVERELATIGSWSLAEKKTACLVALACGLWMTDFAHHLSASSIGVGIGLAALLPGVGVLTIDELKGLNYLSMFFIASCIGMGEVLVQTSGLDMLTRFVFNWMEPLVTNGFVGTIALYWSAFFYHILLSSDVTAVATSLPPLMRFAESQHLNPGVIGMIWTFAGGGKMLIYQSAVLVVGYSYGFFEARDVFRIGVWLTVIECLVLLVLVLFYWPILGMPWSAPMLPH
jgi:sodium-dependent dicarboxylate transporter 2/3/5